MSSGYNPWLDDTLLRQNLAQHFVRMKQEEKEKEEMNNKFKDSYFVYNGVKYPVEIVNENWEGVHGSVIHTLDISVNMNAPIDEMVAYIEHDVKSAMELFLKNKFRIKNVIFNDPATIVFWTDGTKTVVKAQGNDIFDPEKGLAMAMAKKFLGNQGNYYDVFRKWLPEEEGESEQPMGKVLETIDTEDGFTVRFRPNEALKKAFGKLTAVPFDMSSSMSFEFNGWTPKNELVKGDITPNPDQLEEWLDNRDKAMKIRDSLNMRKKPRGR